MVDKPIERKGMYGWYDPGHLLETGIRVGIAGIFGEFLDRRELFSNRLTAEPASFDDAHDYSAHEAKDQGLWVDFVAETGDGWDSTYAVARLLACRSLRFRPQDDAWVGVGDGLAASGDLETRRGKVLIFGGDQVYSTASTKAYRERFNAPYEEVARIEGVEDELKEADVYALPGNHDWYDGLNAFISMFVTRRPGGPREGYGAGRRITRRVARQTRSYFAIKLSEDWWMLGADAQLSGYIDQGQIAFFDDLAQNAMKPGSNIILCAATPSWSYVGLDGPPEKFRNHGYLEDIVTGLVRGNGRRHNLRLVLTGDAHHYARYMEWRGGAQKDDRAAPYTEIAQDARCYLTWGGGGAFMHPTHMLQNVRFDWKFPPPPPVSPLDVTKDTAVLGRSFDLKLIYPDDATSRRLAKKIPLFGFNNWRFSWLMFAFALVVTWALAGTAGLKGEYLPRSLRDNEGRGLLAAAGDLAFLLFSFPWVLLTCLALTAVLAYFSAAQTTPKRWVYGSLHFTSYLVSYFLVFLLLARSIHFKSCTWLEPIVLVLAVSGVMWFVAPFIMGLYLWISLKLRLHWNEAFSSLRIKDHKGFLRLHIKDDTVMIYPIALDTVPDGGDGPLQTRLIERPIRIRDTRMRAA